MKQKYLVLVVVGSMLLVVIFFLVFQPFKKTDRVEEPDKSMEMIKDIDGNEYGIVKIGTQTWMSENLKATRCNDGMPIPLVTDDETWIMLKIPGYGWYRNDEVTYRDVYGAYYNWFAVNTEKLCPVGWHVPSNEEWHTLISFLGGADSAMVNMKSTTDWNYPSMGTNKSGFSGLPGGLRADGGHFFGSGSSGYWWSSDECPAPYGAPAWELTSDIKHNPDIVLVCYHKGIGFNIRCLKDPK